MGAAQSAFTLEDLKATRKRQSRHKLVIRNWNITSFTGKEHELMEKVKLCSPDVVGIPSTKRCASGSNSVEMWDAWKLFCSGVEPQTYSQLGWGGYTLSPQLTGFVDKLMVALDYKYVTDLSDYKKAVVLKKKRVWWTAYIYWFFSYQVIHRTHTDIRIFNAFITRYNNMSRRGGHHYAKQCL